MGTKRVTPEPFALRIRRPLRRTILPTAAVMAIAMAAGCGALTPTESTILSRDMYEIKTTINKYMEEQDSLDRQLKYSLGSIDESLQGRNDITKTALDDMEKRLREQLEEIRSLRSQVEALNFAVDSLSKRLSMGGTLGAAPGGTMNGGVGAPGDAAVGTTGGAAIGAEALLSSAQRQFNLQNYAASRDDLLKGLEQNPSGETKIETLFWLGESYYYLNDPENARRYYRQVMEENDTHAKAWVSFERMGNIFLMQGKKDEALQVLQQIDDAYPRYPYIDRVRATITQIQQSADETGGEAGAPTGNSPAPTTPAPPTN
jgi:TolA-binding protein